MNLAGESNFTAEGVKLSGKRTVWGRNFGKGLWPPKKQSKFLENLSG
jgi:hypothetical protein